MATIERRLAAHDRIGLDTSVFIYHLEAHPRYEPLTSQVLYGVQRGERQAIVSVVALMELTVHPWRRGKPLVASHYEMVLLHFPHLHLVDVNRQIARRAAQLRASYQIRPADALHVATALVNGATAYVTNDRALRRLESLLTIVMLNNFVKGKG